MEAVEVVPLRVMMMANKMGRRRFSSHYSSVLLFVGLALNAVTLQFVVASSASKTTTSIETILTTRCGNSTTKQSLSSSNKKYTAAAASAMKTINSITSSSKTRQQRSNLPNLLSESALMDKETNAIYWQGGSDIISTSLTKPYLTERGVKHVRATILSTLLWLWMWGKVSRYLTSTYFESSSNVADTQQQQLFTIAFTNPILQKIASFLKPIIQFVLLLIHSLLYVRLPSYSPKFLISTIVLYLIEAYTCSTRRYLSHAMDAPTEIETYMEKLRLAKPIVKWKVRCFHYEDRLRRLKELRKKFDNIDGETHLNNVVGDTPPLWMAKKVVTHEAVDTYKFGTCEDHTLASLWKRQQSFSSTSQNENAPFSKLALSKLLVLKDRRAREDYFAQQAAFVTMEGRKDVYAEFATSIEVEGFRPKLLAVRPVRRASHISAALFRQHIYFLVTLLGLSLPFRIWFSKHCDEVKVTVLKETGSSSGGGSASSISHNTAEGEGLEKSSSWFRWGRGSTGASSPSSSTAGGMESKRAHEQFRKNMQSYSLYGEGSTFPNTIDAASRHSDSTFSTQSSHQETTVEEPTEKQPEVQMITRDKLQLMQNVTQNTTADDVAGDVTDESSISTQDVGTNADVDDNAIMNTDDAANRTAIETISLAPLPQQSEMANNDNGVEEDDDENGDKHNVDTADDSH